MRANQTAGTGPYRETGMTQTVLRTFVKIVVASLIVGTVLSHFGITADVLAREIGISQQQILDLLRQGADWVLPNLLLGSLIILPIWFLIYLFRPPGRSSD